MESLNNIQSTVQVLAVVAGVVVSILSFNETRRKDTEARVIDANKPFFELRQKLYTDAVKQAGILANPNVHKPEEVNAARQRFRELYVTELSMVETQGVEKAMVDFAMIVDPKLLQFDDTQNAAYNLAHALRDSYIASAGLK
jgi:hypothetical protein